MSGKKRSVEGFCFDCDIDFVIKVSEEAFSSVKVDTLHCPFCGTETEVTDDDDQDEDEGRGGHDDNWG